MALKFDKKAVLTDLERRARRGVKEAADHVLNESLDRTPVETGNLKASAGKELTSRKLPSITATVFYRAEYALWVHESIEMKLEGQPRPSGLGTYWSPNGEAKFLEHALFQNRERVLAILKKNMELGT